MRRSCAACAVTALVLILSSSDACADALSSASGHVDTVVVSSYSSGSGGSGGGGHRGGGGGHGGSGGGGGRSESHKPSGPAKPAVGGGLNSGKLQYREHVLSLSIQPHQTQVLHGGKTLQQLFTTAPAADDPDANKTVPAIGFDQTPGWAFGSLGLTGTNDPANPDPLVTLLEQAAATISIPLPSIATTPPRGGIQLVGLPVWFWSTNHQPTSATASITDLSATITAVPGPLVVDMGDGTTLVCPGGGTPYNPALPSSSQASDCSAPYDRHATYTVTASVTWALSWTATNGQSGTLPSVTRSTSFALAVQQAQGVTD